MVELPQQHIPGSTETTIIGTPATGFSRLYGPAQPEVVSSPLPSPFDSTLFTVPANTQAVWSRIHAVNTTPSAAWLTLTLGPLFEDLAILWEYELAGNDFLDLEVFFPMFASETIHGIQGTAGAITVTLTGAVTAA